MKTTIYWSYSNKFTEVRFHRRPDRRRFDPISPTNIWTITAILLSIPTKLKLILLIRNN